MRTIFVLVSALALSACATNSRIRTASEIACQNREAIKVAISNYNAASDQPNPAWYTDVTRAFDIICDYLFPASN